MKTEFSTSRSFGIILVLISGACWGFHGVIIKKAYAVGASFQQVFFAETLFASIFFLFFIRSFGGKQRPRTPNQWRDLAICGIASMALGTFLFLAFSLGPIAIGATLLFLYMPQVYGYAVFTGIQSFSYLKTFSICLLLVGAGATTNILGALKGDGFTGAILAALAASTSYAIIFLLTPRLSSFTNATFRSFSISFICFLGSGAMLLAFPFMRNHEPIEWLPFLALALVLGLLGQTIPVITLMKGIPIVGSSIAGALASIELPVAVISSAIFLGETVTITQSLGVALVFIGILLFNLPTQNAELKPKAATP
ncbi:MAG: hypothetical protein CMI15_10475 [Opitutaceae bacterium]|nr:hypothetical protein [Opitutaceae bacterium]